jgi:putative tricarboxylic transport membrane protein
MLFVQHGEVVHGLYVGLLVANIAMLIIGYLIMGPCIWLVSRPKPYLMAFIYALVVSGVYAYQANLFNVGVALAFGVIGYGLRYFAVPFLPMVLGVVLGFMVESNYRRALVLSNGDLTTFIRNPIAASLLAAAVIVLGASLLRQAKQSRAGAR